MECHKILKQATFRWKKLVNDRKLFIETDKIHEWSGLMNQQEPKRQKAIMIHTDEKWDLAQCSSNMEIWKIQWLYHDQVKMTTCPGIRPTCLNPSLVILMHNELPVHHYVEMGEALLSNIRKANLIMEHII